MIPVRALLISRLLRSAWRVGVVALLIATLMEWGLGSVAVIDVSWKACDRVGAGLGRGAGEHRPAGVSSGRWWTPGRSVEVLKTAGRARSASRPEA